MGSRFYNGRFNHSPFQIMQDHGCFFGYDNVNRSTAWVGINLYQIFIDFRCAVCYVYGDAVRGVFALAHRNPTSIIAGGGSHKLLIGSTCNGQFCAAIKPLVGCAGRSGCKG